MFGLPWSIPPCCRCGARASPTGDGGGVMLGAVPVFSIGYMGWPHVVTRHRAKRRLATTRVAGAYATLWNLLFVPTPYIVGILAIVVLPRLDDPELANFRVSQTLLPPAVLAPHIRLAVEEAARMGPIPRDMLATLQREGDAPRGLRPAR
jgi:Na+/pantothenate symporter